MVLTVKAIPHRLYAMYIPGNKSQFIEIKVFILYFLTFIGIPPVPGNIPGRQRAINFSSAEALNLPLGAFSRIWACTI